MISQFFIDRPVFAWVLAIVLMLAGGIAAVRLPVMQYPAIAPPQVSINVNYPGASAQTVQDTVVQVIEQQLNGIDKLDYITADSELGRHRADHAHVRAGHEPRHRAGSGAEQAPARDAADPAGGAAARHPRDEADAQLPRRARLHLRDGSMTSEEIGDYVATNVLDPLNRTPGVGDVNMFGSQYAMRMWLDPDEAQRTSRSRPADIIAAIRAQNVQVSAGQLGGLPAAPGQELNATR